VGLTVVGSATRSVLAEVAAGVRRANQDLARAEQVRRFTLLPAEWTAETGELTPTLKRRRRVIAERYAADIERLYGPPGPGVIDVTPEPG
jgi:long-chain acyl-CoA synthetase